MDIAWFAPPAVLLSGAAIAAVLLRRLATAVDEVAGAERRVRDLQRSLVPVRVQTRRARASLDRFDHR